MLFQASFVELAIDWILPTLFQGSAVKLFMIALEPEPLLVTVGQTVGEGHSPLRELLFILEPKMLIFSSTMCRQFVLAMS